MRTFRGVMLGAVLLAGLAGARRLPAQSGPPLPRLMNEGRVDARWSRSNSVELGWSLIIPSSVYVRSALTAAGGYVRRDQRWMRESRYEATTRFLLDPFRQARYGLSVGGGVGLTNSDGLFGEPDVLGIRKQRWRPYLAAFADLELRKAPGLTPALQVGIGSGVRVGIAVRSATNRWR
ncbi:MAG TPA: hypothetical protein VFO55_01770 [Gemmatimonadaceae bacterium]|nr:hypothetical protein [Gemmatimonadaceae bacterium]